MLAGRLRGGDNLCPSPPLFFFSLSLSLTLTIFLFLSLGLHFSIKLNYILPIKLHNNSRPAGGVSTPHPHP